jgi:CRP-like cAMP-binding protein/di/tricarboxylate transporter
VKLTRIEMFKGLSNIELAKLLGMMEKRESSAGTVLFEQGDAGDSMFIIESGAIELFVRKEDNARQSLAILGEGDVVGEMALLTGEPRSASAVVAKTAVLYCIDRKIFELIIAEHAMFSAYFIRLLSQRLTLTNERLQHARTAEAERMATKLAKLPDRLAELVLWCAHVPVVTHALATTRFGTELSEQLDVHGWMQQFFAPAEQDRQLLVVTAKWRQTLGDLAKERYSYEELGCWTEEAIHWYVEQREWLNAMRLYAELGNWAAALELSSKAVEQAEAVQRSELLRLLGRCPQERLVAHYPALQGLLQLCGRDFIGLSCPIEETEAVRGMYGAERVGKVRSKQQRHAEQAFTQHPRLNTVEASSRMLAKLETEEAASQPLSGSRAESASSRMLAKLETEEAASQPLSGSRAESASSRMLAKLETEEAASQPLSGSRAESASSRMLAELETEEAASQPLSGSRAESASSRMLAKLETEEAASQPLTESRAESAASRMLTGLETEEAVSQSLPESGAVETADEPPPSAATQLSAAERAALGLSALEAALKEPERYTPAQRLELYERGMELAHAAGEGRLALRYSQLAERQASLPEERDGADASRAYGLARQKLGRAKSAQLARSAGRLLKGNRPAELGAVTAAALCVIAAFIMPPAWGLSAAGVKFLGLAIAAVILWIAAVVPDYIVALGMLMLWVLGGVATPETALSGFASPSWLFMICIMAFSAVIMKSGISYRFALYALKRFPRSYRGQLWGIVAGGILLNPLLPSSSAKVSLGVPMAQTLAESMGFGDRSRGSAGLGLVAMIFFGFTAPFVMTGSYTNIMAYGLAASEQSISWLQWLLYAWPAFMLFGGIMLVGLLLAFRKVEPVRMVAGEVLDEQLRLLGPLTKDERVALWTTLACIVMMMLEPVHGVASAWVMLGGFAVLVISGVLDKQTIASGIDWTFLLFLGAAFSFAGVAQELGIAELLSSLLGSHLSVLAASPGLFLVAVVLVSFLVTLVIRDDPAVIMLVTAIVPLGAALGIHPWVLVFLILLATDPFFFAYQSPTYLTAYYTSEGKSFTHRQAQRTALLYGAAVLLVAVLCAPYWKWLGLIN